MFFNRESLTFEAELCAAYLKKNNEELLLPVKLTTLDQLRKAGRMKIKGWNIHPIMSKILFDAITEFESGADSRYILLFGKDNSHFLHEYY